MKLHPNPSSVRFALFLFSLLASLSLSPAKSIDSAAPAATPCFLNVRDFGAAGDGKTKDTAAIQRAIDAAAQRGGGTVCLPPGTYLSGSLALKSHVTLRIDSGATLKGSQDFKDYKVSEGRWEGVVTRQYSGLISAVDQEQVAVTGHGVIDGQGKVWWDLIFKRKAIQDRMLKDAKKRGEKLDKETMKLVPANAQEAESLRLAAIPRPRLLSFIRCKGVRVEGVTLTNSPAWTVHPAFCEDVVVDGITIMNPDESPNTDGINPDSCKNVRIANCLLNCGDDCVTLKSGKDEEGRRIGQPTENVTVSNCVMLAGHGGIVIGSEMSGGVRDVAVTGCVFRGTDQGIRIKSQRGRGGVVENLAFSNIMMHDIVKNGIIMTMSYSGKSEPEAVSERTPNFRNVTISNIRIDGAQATADIEGLEEKPLEGLVLANIDARTSQGLTITRVKDLVIDRVAVTVDKGAGLAIDNSTGVKIDDFKSVQADAKQPAIALEDVAGAWVRNCQAVAGTETFLRVEGKKTSKVLLSNNDLGAAKKAVAVKDAPEGAVTQR